MRCASAGGSGKIDEDLAVAILDRIGAHRIVADQRLAGAQIEFPIVPIAGQHAAGAQRAFGQRIAFVRAAIGDGEDAILGRDQQDLLAVAADELLALCLKIGARDAGVDEHGAIISARRA